MKTITTWKTGQAFESTYNNRKIEVDGGGGFSPKALLLTGLAACSGIDVVDILEKMRVPFASLEIDVRVRDWRSPRIRGMAQNAQRFLQPSEIFKYARWRG